MLKATGDIVYKPYQEFRRTPKGQRELGVSSPSGSRTPSIASSADAASIPGSEVKKSSPKLRTTGAAMGGSAKSVGKVIGYWYKGMLIDMPLAVSEGLRAVPQLYGDEVKDHGTIRDWKSGASFAGNNFVHGMADGLSGIFTEPYKGSQEEGAKGLMKGLAKGTLGVTTKVSSGKFIALQSVYDSRNEAVTNSSQLTTAALGLVAYPAHGMMKSLYTATHSKTRKQISQARIQEGKYLAEHPNNGRGVYQKIIRNFEAIYRNHVETTCQSSSDNQY